jgi:hypothetical protein
VEQKVAELLTGEYKESPPSRATEWGIEHEEEARQEFINRFGYPVAMTGFHTYGEHAGGSPDGIYQDEFTGNAILEIKCPYDSTNHIKHSLIRTKEQLKSECPDYYWQIIANMVFANCMTACFVSYDPRMMDEKKRLHHLFIGLEPTDEQELIGKLEKAIAYKTAIIETLNN